MGQQICEVSATSQPWKKKKKNFMFQVCYVTSVLNIIITLLNFISIMQAIIPSDVQKHVMTSTLIF